MSNLTRELQIAREMTTQGVVSDNDLKGPLGDEIRAERKPYFEELVRQGKMAPSVLTKFW